MVNDNSGIFIVNFEQITHHTFFTVYVADFEQGNVSGVDFNTPKQILFVFSCSKSTSAGLSFPKLVVPKASKTLTHFSHTAFDLKYHRNGLWSICNILSFTLVLFPFPLQNVTLLR